MASADRGGVGMLARMDAIPSPMPHSIGETTGGDEDPFSRMRTSEQRIVGSATQDPEKTQDPKKTWRIRLQIGATDRDGVRVEVPGGWATPLSIFLLYSVGIQGEPGGVSPMSSTLAPIVGVCEPMALATGAREATFSRKTPDARKARSAHCVSRQSRWH